MAAIADPSWEQPRRRVAVGSSGVATVLHCALLLTHAFPLPPLPSDQATLALLSKALAHTDARRMYLAAVDIFDRTQVGAASWQGWRMPVTGEVACCCRCRLSLGTATSVLQPMMSVAAPADGWLLTCLRYARWPQKDNLVEQCLKAMTRKFNENPDVRHSAAQHSTADAAQHRTACTAQRAVPRSCARLVFCLFASLWRLTIPISCWPPPAAAGLAAGGQVPAVTRRRRGSAEDARPLVAGLHAGGGRQLACRVLRWFACVTLVGSEALCSLYLQVSAACGAQAPLFHYRPSPWDICLPTSALLFCLVPAVAAQV